MKKSRLNFFKQKQSSNNHTEDKDTDTSNEDSYDNIPTSSVQAKLSEFYITSINWINKHKTLSGLSIFSILLVVLLLILFIFDPLGINKGTLQLGLEFPRKEVSISENNNPITGKEETTYDPTSFKIYIDNERVFLSPSFEITREVKSGKRKIIVETNDFKDLSFEVNVQRGKYTTIPIQLESSADLLFKVSNLDTNEPISDFIVEFDDNQYTAENEEVIIKDLDLSIFKGQNLNAIVKTDSFTRIVNFTDIKQGINLIEDIYVSSFSEPFYFFSQNSAQLSLYKATLTGTNPELILTTNAPSYFKLNAARDTIYFIQGNSIKAINLEDNSISELSSNNRNLAGIMFSKNFPAAFISYLDGDEEILKRIRLDNNKQETVSKFNANLRYYSSVFGDVEMSSDGRYIYFVKQGAHKDDLGIYRIDSLNGGKHDLIFKISGTENVNLYNFTRDGRYALAKVNHHDGTIGIWKVDLLNGAHEKITAKNSGISNLNLIENDSRITYSIGNRLYLQDFAFESIAEEILLPKNVALQNYQKLTDRFIIFTESGRNIMPKLYLFDINFPNKPPVDIFAEIFDVSIVN